MMDFFQRGCRLKKISEKVNTSTRSVLVASEVIAKSFQACV